MQASSSLRTLLSIDVNLCNVRFSCLPGNARFVNELATRAVVTKAIFEHGAVLESDREQAAAAEGALAPTVAYVVMNE